MSVPREELVPVIASLSERYGSLNAAAAVYAWRYGVPVPTAARLFSRIAAGPARRVTDRIVDNVMTLAAS